MKNRHLLIIFVVVLVNMLAFGIVIPLLPYLADKTGASEFQIGLLVASYPLAQLVGAPLLGIYGDRGNAMVLRSRLAWRGIEARLIEAEASALAWSTMPTDAPRPRGTMPATSSVPEVSPKM